ncbi:peroxide stress protein YaaA [Nocardiopsis ansamitocini]|uniref:UPF0246 protein n=1 Tax=Nocardiopsis ansamitocini TaxID=1670832 RepID=A0A9W6UIU0_9ACTN|nr:peroxide stress protein YaaA [Nocardiopsis ansamitocini]GLU48047.1 UPF0246 protein [Nocardiopsis ansamitocini]
MLILLPPSEGKATTGNGSALELTELGLSEVTPAREQVMTALEAVCARPEAEARKVLGLTPGQTDALHRNRELRTSATLRAADLYTGVLYDALGLPELLAGSTSALTEESTLIFSGLWGVVGPRDALPPYRLSMGVKLPPLGALGAFWRGHLSEALGKRAAGQLVVDCRSAAYAAAFRPDADTAERTVTVRVLREAVTEGVAKRSVVSHMAKATRGEIAHTLLAEGLSPQTPHELAETLGGLGHTVELRSPERRGKPFSLDVVVTG